MQLQLIKAAGTASELYFLENEIELVTTNIYQSQTSRYTMPVSVCGGASGRVSSVLEPREYPYTRATDESKAQVRFRRVVCI